MAFKVYLLQSCICEFVLVSDMHLDQERAVCGQGHHRDIPQLLAPIGSVLLQPRTV